MSTTTTPWSLPPLKVTRPNRAFMGVYRTADKHVDGQTLAGVPLQTTTDAVVAAVQLGYKVADAQIARGKRMARSLDRSARSAGMRNWIEPTDAAEQLIVRTVLTALEWIEQAALDPKGPARRIVRAQYDAMGTMFGLRDRDRDRDRDGDARASASPPHEQPRESRASRERRHESRASRERHDPLASRDAHDAAAPRRPPIDVRHAPGSARKAVRAVSIEPWDVRLAEPAELAFHHAADLAAPPLAGKLAPGKPLVLEVSTALEHPGGVWRAAVCQGDLQVGLIELDL